MLVVRRRWRRFRTAPPDRYEHHGNRGVGEHPADRLGSPRAEVAGPPEQDEHRAVVRRGAKDLSARITTCEIDGAVVVTDVSQPELARPVLGLVRGSVPER